MKTTSFHINSESGNRLSAKLYLHATSCRRFVIFCHGLFSNKDGYKITALAHDIVCAGFNLLTFDFSCVGESEGKIEDISILNEIKDLESAVAFCKEKGAEEIHLFGSSMGALVCLLYAGSNRNDVSSLTLIAIPFDIETLLLKATGIADLRVLPKEGHSSFDGILLKNSFFLEATTINPLSAAKEITVPTLVIHGANDEVVDIEHAYRFVSMLTRNRKLVVIGDGDHNLTRPEDIRAIRNELLVFLAENSRFSS